MWKDGTDTYMYLSISTCSLFTQKSELIQDKFNLIQRKLEKLGNWLSLFFPYFSEFQQNIQSSQFSFFHNLTQMDV